jgi:hypothetical protein
MAFNPLPTHKTFTITTFHTLKKKAESSSGSNITGWWHLSLSKTIDALMKRITVWDGE